MTQVDEIAPAFSVQFTQVRADDVPVAPSTRNTTHATSPLPASGPPNDSDALTCPGVARLELSAKPSVNAVRYTPVACSTAGS